VSRLAEAAASLVEAGQRMDARNWVPGSAGNLSARLDQESIAITRSGVHKGRLKLDDIIEVSLEGAALEPGRKPSAETLLHCQLYRLFPQIGAELHGHSVAATVLSMAGSISFSGYEIIKAFGFADHEVDVDLPIFENDQDIARLAKLTEPALLAEPPIGYVIRGHGLYAWGTSVEHAFWRLEALEFLLECELQRKQIHEPVDHIR
jgi:methylthioribulose-1-phosphate dehydratase